MKIQRLIILYTVLLVSAATFVLPGAEPENKTGPKNWSLAVNGGITLNAGNTESRLISAGLKFTLKKKKVEFLTNFDAFYGSDKQEQTVNKGKWFNRFVNKRKKYFNLYGTLALEYDILARIGLRGSGGAGIQYSLAGSPETNVKLAAGINGEFTNGLQELGNTRSIRFNLNYTREKAFSKTAKYSLDILYTSNFGRFFKEYRIEAGASLVVVLKKPLSLRIEIQEKYTNRPLLETLDKNDFILVTPLEVSI